MKPAGRKNDHDSQGHKLTSSLANTVTIDNLPAAVKGCKTNNGERIVNGSDTVTIENKPAARKGDKTNNGHKIIDGSDTVFIG